MRVYSQNDRDICNLILIKGSESIFGELDKHSFKKAESALLIVNATSDVYLLTKDGIDKSVIYQSIIDKVSLLTYCEKEGLIYCLPSLNTLGKAIILNEGIGSQMGFNTSTEDYSFENGHVSIADDEAICYNKQGDILMRGAKYSKSFADQVIHYYTSLLYPTSLLKTLQSHNFLSFEESAYKREIEEAKNSRNRAYVALVISLLTPFLAVFFSNYFGKSTLDREQFDSLILEQRNSSARIDSVNKTMQHFFIFNNNGSKDTIVQNKEKQMEKQESSQCQNKK